MAGLLSKYNRIMHERMKDGGVSKDGFDPLEKYRDAKEDRDLIEVSFSYADKDGNLFMKDENGVLVRCLYEDLLEAMPYYNTYLKDRFIGSTFVSRIKAIDEENRVVTVVSARSNEKATKSRLMSEIKSSLDKGHSPVVVGRVVKVEPKRIYVDILNKGILGVCGIKYWRKGYVQEFREEVSSGELLDFEVTGVLKPRNETSPRRPGYLLSRLNLTSDPWEGIPDSLTAGAAIVVKCIDKPEGKGYWWGTSDLCPGVSIMCDYNKKVSEIRPSLLYKCKIFRLDKEKRTFQVTPIEAVDSGFSYATAENLKILSRGSNK